MTRELLKREKIKRNDSLPLSKREPKKQEKLALV